MVWHFIAVNSLSRLIPHPSKLSAATEKERGKKKNEILEFQQLHKRLAYVKTAARVPRTRHCSPSSVVPSVNKRSLRLPLTSSSGAHKMYVPLTSCPQQFLGTSWESYALKGGSPQTRDTGNRICRSHRPVFSSRVRESRFMRSERRALKTPQAGSYESTECRDRTKPPLEQLYDTGPHPQHSYRLSRKQVCYS